MATRLNARLCQLYRNFQTPLVPHRATCHQAIQVYTYKTPKLIINGHLKDSFMSSTNIPGAAIAIARAAPVHWRLVTEVNTYIHCQLPLNLLRPRALPRFVIWRSVERYNSFYKRGFFGLTTSCLRKKYEETVRSKMAMKLNTAATEYFNLLREV